MQDSNPIRESVLFEKEDLIDVDLLDTVYPDENQPVPIRKLQDTFDSLAKPEEYSLKVFLRVRPVPENIDITARVLSETTIVTNAPSISNRAKTTKQEERQYVR